MEVNFFAVIAAALAAFVIGSLWYSPKLFGKLWAKHSNIFNEKKPHKPLVYVFSFIFYFISAWAFALLIGPDATVLLAVYAGAALGVLFVTMCFGINYLFSGRSVVLLIIDGAYHILQFLIYGLVLGL
jgi:hypothetical protein